MSSKKASRCPRLLSEFHGVAAIGWGPPSPTQTRRSLATPLLAAMSLLLHRNMMIRRLYRVVIEPLSLANLFRGRPACARRRQAGATAARHAGADADSAQRNRAEGASAAMMRGSNGSNAPQPPPADQRTQCPSHASPTAISLRDVG
jgi:hypothetical protein